MDTHAGANKLGGERKLQDRGIMHAEQLSCRTLVAIARDSRLRWWTRKGRLREKRRWRTAQRIQSGGRIVASSRNLGVERAVARLGMQIFVRVGGLFTFVVALARVEKKWRREERRKRQCSAFAGFRFYPAFPFYFRRQGQRYGQHSPVSKIAGSGL